MIYTIHGNAERQRSEDLVAVPENLAPWALVAPPIWLMVHRLWWPLTFYFLFVMLTSAVSATSFAAVSMALTWLPGVYLWLEGRELYRRKLQNEGFELVGIVSADDEEEAIMRHIMRERLDISPSVDLEIATTQVTQSGLRRAWSRPEQSSAGSMFGLFSTEES